MDTKKILAANGVTVADFVRYYLFMTEFHWTRNFPKEDGPESMMISVFDFNHLKFSNLTKEVGTSLLGLENDLVD